MEDISDRRVIGPMIPLFCERESKRAFAMRMHYHAPPRSQYLCSLCDKGFLLVASAERQKKSSRTAGDPLFDVKRSHQVCSSCKNVFFGMINLGQESKEMRFEGNSGTSQRIVLADYLLRVFSYRQAGFAKQAQLLQVSDPKIFFNDSYVGLLSNIVPKFWKYEGDLALC